MAARADHRVDVIIPTCNRPTLTVEAVKSVQAQTFSDWHLYVVDDASDDDTPEHIERVAAFDPRITLLRRTVRGGGNPARQTAFVSSTAPLVALLDSDDLWEPTKLERQLSWWDHARTRSENVGPVLCWHDAVDSSGTRRGEPLRPRVGRRWHPFTAFNTSTPLIARTLLEEAGGFAPSEPYIARTADHVELFLRLTRRHSTITVPELLVHCRHHDGSRNSDHQRTVAAADEAAELLQDWDSALRRAPRERAWLYGWVGGRYLQVGDARRAAPYFGTALTADGMATAAHIVGHYAPLALRLLTPRRSRT